MTSLFSSSSANEAVLPISAFSYRNVGALTAEAHAQETKSAPSTEKQAASTKQVTQQEIDWLVEAARTEAAVETRTLMQAEMEARVAAEAQKSKNAIESFQAEQKKYFSKVEAEVVQLSLAIAARILHRESQVDSMLVAGLVRVAIEKLHNGSTLTVRVPPSEGAKWRQRLTGLETNYEMSVVEDAQMRPDECVLETALGTADFSVEAQLKEVERGFFDLLALRPQGR